MDKEKRKANKNRFLIGAIIYATLFLAIVLIVNLDKVNLWLSGVLLLLRPILIGLALAYLCNPFFRFFERQVLFKLRPPSLRRALSLILTYLTVLLIIALILVLIIPQLFDSIAAFASNYKLYMESATEQINLLISRINSIVGHITGSNDFLNPIASGETEQKLSELFGINGDKLLEYIANLNMKPITDVIGNTVSILTDSLFAIFISLYLLSTKEKRYAQIMKLRRALFSDSVNGEITRFCTIADRSFGGFLEGKLLDSLIIGILTYIVISLFRIPYAVLIATFIGITNIIPVIGPLIGAIPTAFILLLSAPGKVIPFLIIVIVIQQIDGNIIGPKILGSNTGVSSLCVMIAITTMGSLWGLVGMLLGVPLFATILEITDEYLTTKLQRKGMPSGVENYYAADAIVDPAKNAHITTDRFVRKFERYALRMINRQENGEKLKQRHKMALGIYALLLKYHVIKKLTDEEQARFSAEEAVKAAIKESDELLEKYRNPDHQANTAAEAGASQD